MSVFDGLSGVLNNVFGAPVLLTPPSGPAVTATGILREAPDFETDPDRREHFTPIFTLQVPKPIPAELVRGATVTAAHMPGKTFRVSGVYPDRSPAADAFMVAHLELRP